MALVLLDRAKVVATSMSGNTSNYTLTNAPPTGFVDFTGVGDGNTTYYVAVDDLGSFEIGIGTFTLSTEVLTRTDGNVIVSSNVGNNDRVSWPSNSTPTVFIAQPADKAVFTDSNGDVTLKTSDGAILNLQTSDTIVGNGDILGAINFQAPDEANGGDGIEIAAVIEAEAKTNFKSNANETDLVFKVANDAAATERMRLTHSGALELTSTTNEDNLLIKTTFSSETNSTPDVKLYNDSTQSGESSLGLIKFSSNTANHSNHQFADIVGMAFSTTQNALEGGVRFRFAEGSSHAWGANEWMNFRPAKIQYYNGSNTSTLAFTTPTSNRTLTLPDATGTIALTSDISIAADDITTGDASVTLGTSDGDVTLSSNGTGSNGDIILDSNGDIVLDANSASTGQGIYFKDSGTTFAHFSGNDFYGASYFTQDLEVRANLEIQSTSATANASPIFKLWRDSSSPAADDDIGQISFDGEDSGGTRTAYAGITGEIINPTHGNEEGQIYFIIANGDNSLTNGYTTTYKFGASRLLLDGATQLQFGDNGTYIHQSADGVLDLVADTELELNGAIVDINSTNGNVDIGTTGGNVALTGAIGSMNFTNNGSANIILDPAANGYGVEIKGNNAGGYVQLNCENNSHGVKLQSPDHSAGQSYTLKLPDNQVAVDKILKVKSISGSGATAIGQLEFADESGGGGSTAADDITAGDAAVTIATTTGDITIDAQGSDTDIIFKGTDDTTDITALTLDMSNAGKATFNDDIQVNKDVFLESVGTGTKPLLDLYWKKLSTTQSIGQIKFNAYRTPGIGRTFATIDAYSPNNTNGSELGSLKFGLTIGNTTTTRAELTATSASGGIFRLQEGFDLSFRGQSGSAGYTTLTVTNPTQNNTITLPDATGTVALTSDLGGGGGVTVQDEGSALSTAGTTLNFVGAGVVASGTGATKTITIAGGGSGITVQDEGSALSTAGTTLNFVGAGVTASGTGATKTVTISGGSGGITTGKAIAMAMVFG